MSKAKWLDEAENLLDEATGHRLRAAELLDKAKALQQRAEAELAESDECTRIAQGLIVGAPKTTEV